MNHKILLVAIALLIGTYVSAQKSTNLTININGITTEKGSVEIAIYKNSNGFPSKSKKAFKKFLIPVNKIVTKPFVTNLPLGTYAIAVYHDANSNKKLDTNFFGIPKEKTGVSNNTVASGVPSFYDAKFVLLKEKSISVQLH